jgi:hypothetical protein
MSKSSVTPNKSNDLPTKKPTVGMKKPFLPKKHLSVGDKCVPPVRTTVVESPQFKPRKLKPIEPVRIKFPADTDSNPFPLVYSVPIHKSVMCTICLVKDSDADMQLLMCGCTFHELCFKSLCYEQFTKDQTHYECVCNQTYTFDVNHALIPIMKLDSVLGFELMTEIQEFASKRIHDFNMDMYTRNSESIKHKMDECIKSRPHKKSRVTVLHGTVKHHHEELQNVIQDQKHNDEWIENTQSWLTSSKLMLEKECKSKSENLMLSCPDEKNKGDMIENIDHYNSLEYFDF